MCSLMEHSSISTHIALTNNCYHKDFAKVEHSTQSRLGFGDSYIHVSLEHLVHQQQHVNDNGLNEKACSQPSLTKF